MTPCLLGQEGGGATRSGALELLAAWSAEPLAWGLLLSAVALLLALPGTGPRRRLAGSVAGLLGLALLAVGARWLGAWPHVVYCGLAAVTLGSAAACICSRSPVYAAVWFAASLLGVSGLFFYSGALFLGAATVVVYAGAIVVTFLFVIMLAQPEGHATYDRITWAAFPKPLSILAGAALVSAVVVALGPPPGGKLRERVEYRLAQLIEDEPTLDGADVASLRVVHLEGRGQVGVFFRHDVDAEAALRVVEELARVMGPTEAQVHSLILPERTDVLHPEHVARLGGVLFSRYLVPVEMAAALLLTALVGAVAIVMHGREAPRAEAAGAGSPR